MIATRKWIVKSRLLDISDWNRLGHLSGFRVKLLAGRIKVSVRQLERFFHDHFKVSLRSWLQGLLAAEAKQLLLQDRSIKEVATALGQSTTSNFSRTFRRVVGLSPSTFQIRSRSTENAAAPAVTEPARVKPAQMSRFEWSNELLTGEPTDTNTADPKRIEIGLAPDSLPGKTLKAQESKMIAPMEPTDGWKEAGRDRPAEISAVWRNGARQTMDLAEIVLLARQASLRGEWSELWRKETMPFSKRKAEMLAGIGEHLAWANAQTFARLPSGWSTLYYLSKLSQETIVNEFAHVLTSSCARRTEEPCRPKNPCTL